ncbi:hypothetical protein J4404_01175 [Candidatus Woesearchaeota archaeon]|nr:hypothetical protein [Candidatus Woesearchaeota archaeon]
MKDQMYILRGKNLEEIYKNLRGDLGSVAMQINEGSYIYPYPSDLQAIVNIGFQRETQEVIGLKFMPAIEDEILLKNLTDIIKKYKFELVDEQEAKEAIFVIPTKQ